MLNKILQKIELESKGQIQIDLNYINNFLIYFQELFSTQIVNISTSVEKKNLIFYYFKNNLLAELIRIKFSSLLLSQNKDTHKFKNIKLPIGDYLQDINYNTYFSLLSYLTRPRISVMIALGFYYIFYGKNSANEEDRIFYGLFYLTFLQLNYEFFQYSKLLHFEISNFLGIYGIVSYIFIIIFNICALPFKLINKGFGRIVSIIQNIMTLKYKLKSELKSDKIQERNDLQIINRKLKKTQLKKEIIPEAVPEIDAEAYTNNTGAVLEEKFNEIPMPMPAPAISLASVSQPSIAPVKSGRGKRFIINISIFLGIFLVGTIIFISSMKGSSAPTKMQAEISSPAINDEESDILPSSEIKLNEKTKDTTPSITSDSEPKGNTPNIGVSGAGIISTDIVKESVEDYCKDKDYFLCSVNGVLKKYGISGIDIVFKFAKNLLYDPDMKLTIFRISIFIIIFILFVVYIYKSWNKIMKGFFNLLETIFRYLGLLIYSICLNLLHFLGRYLGINKFIYLLGIVSIISISLFIYLILGFVDIISYIIIILSLLIYYYSVLLNQSAEMLIGITFLNDFNTENIQNKQLNEEKQKNQEDNINATKKELDKIF